MRVALVQHDICWEDKSGTHHRVEALLDGMKDPNIDLIVLPEMFDTGFSMNVTSISDTQTGETIGFLRSQAIKRKSALVAGITVDAPNERGWNQCVVLDSDGSELTRYTKLRPFILTEAKAYDPGSETAYCSVAGVPMSPFICYDLRFPEVFRVAGYREVALMTIIASWPVMRIHHWEALLVARAIENQCYVVGVNRVGSDPNLEYNGHSMMVDYSGEVIAHAGERETIVTGEIDLEALRKYRRHLPFVRDMQRYSFPTL